MKTYIYVRSGNVCQNDGEIHSQYNKLSKFAKSFHKNWNFLKRKMSLQFTCSRQFLEDMSRYEPHSLRNILYHAAFLLRWNA